MFLQDNTDKPQNSPQWLQWLNASSSFGWNETGESNRDREGESLLQLHLASAHWPYPKFSTQKNNATLPPNRLVIRLIPLMPSLIHSGLLHKMEMERMRGRGMARHVEREGESVNTGWAAMYSEEFVLCRFFFLFLPSLPLLRWGCVVKLFSPRG